MANRQPDPDPWDLEVLATLQERGGLETIVVLENGDRLTVLDIAWGYDMGDEFSHITTNCSPGEEGRAMDFFYTNEVNAILVPGANAPLLERRRA